MQTIDIPDAVWAVMYTDGITYTSICSLWVTKELAEAARVEAGSEAVGDGSGYYVEPVSIGGTRHVAPCVWKQTEFGWAMSCESAFALRKPGGRWKVCPYCGNPLSVEGNTHG